MHDFDAFERDFADALRSDADASVGPFEAGAVARAAIADTGPHATPRVSLRPTRRFGRGRGTTLLAAAALLVVGGAFAAASGIVRLPTVVPPVPPSVVAVATPTLRVASPSPRGSAAPSASARPIPATGPGSWIPTGSMRTARSGSTAVRLLDGRVLVVGGSIFDPTEVDGRRELTSTELYDPATGTWSATGELLWPSDHFPATLLLDGRVLVGAEGDRAQVYDPSTGSWTETGLAIIKGGSTATLLGDGRVLVIDHDPTAKIFDPETATWTATGTMTTPRHSHTAIRLADGKVLVAGGHAPADDATAAAELFDPATGMWTAIADMHREREFISSVPQPDGTVLVLGSSRGLTQSAERYDPTYQTWTLAADGSRRDSEPVATLLDDGRVLVTGNDTTAGLFDPVAGSWSTAAPMFGPHGGWTVLLRDGTVLVAGGHACSSDDVCVATGAAELYVPAGVSPPSLPAFPNPTPPVIPSPTPRPTPFPPAAGPVPPNARTWTVTVDNKSSEPATVFVAEEGENGTLRLVGSASPNVIPAGATVKVTFRFPAKGGPDGWIYVNPRPGEGGSFFRAADIGTPGKFVITAEGDAGWLSP